MRVGLVAARNSTVVGLVGCVNVAVLLAIAAVCKSPVATWELTLERLFTCNHKIKHTYY